MDIEEAFREAALRVNDLPEDGAAWLEEIASDIWRGIPEGGDAASTLVKFAFVAGQIYQEQFQTPEDDTPESVEEKFRLISGFIDLINNRTGE